MSAYACGAWPKTEGDNLIQLRAYRVAAENYANELLELCIQLGTPLI